MRSHNVEECVLVLDDEGTVIVGAEVFDVDAGVNTWKPVGVPHRFVNCGAGTMRIFWVYGGLGERSFEHVSMRDRI